MSLIEESNTEEMQMFRDMILRFLEQEVSPHVRNMGEKPQDAT